MEGTCLFQGRPPQALRDQAGWKGLGFQTCEGEIPLLMFGFEHAAVGNKIFENIAKTIGDKDPNNTLRIALITALAGRIQRIIVLLLQVILIGLMIALRKSKQLFLEFIL